MTGHEPRGARTRRFGVVSLVLRGGDLAADVGLAARAGVDGMSVEAAEVLRVGVDHARRLFADAGLAVATLISVGPGVERGATGSIDGDLAVLDAAAALDAAGVLASAGPRGELPGREADARVRAWLERLAPRAADLDLDVMIEPMFPMMRAYSYVHTLPHALELVAGLAGAKVVVDTGHLWWDPRLVETFAAHVDDIGTVQLTNISTHALDTLRYSRAPFDDGEIALRGLIEAFDAAGYRGWYENEVLTKHPDDRVRFVGESRVWFDAIWTETA